MMQATENIKPSTQQALNPIYEYAARGQYHENRMEWEGAVHWYHRALACLPNLFGSDRKIRPLDIPLQKSVSFKPQHASRIYAALGHALMALGRSQDSLLAYQAAGALDPDNKFAIDFLKTNSAILDEDQTEAPSSLAGKDSTGICEKSDLKDAVTLIMVTHCTRRLKKFEALSPPSSRLVTATYGSLLEVFGEAIATCPKIMCYDFNPNGTERDRLYSSSIEAFSRQNGFSLRRFQGVGLFNVLNQTVPSVTTPYIFFVEHDWMFKGGKMQLSEIIEMMASDPGVNTIRFNKRENFLNGQDFLMNVDSKHRRYPLLRTSSYSNNPSIVRTDKLRNEWLPICDEALHLVRDELGGRAFGVEEILFRKYVHDIRTHGFRKAHARWGINVFGTVGAPAKVMHLGE